MKSQEHDTIELNIIVTI